ncbi:MAG: M23 family metallopeptidase [Nitrospira sp.]|nr:M23 family metallopeptidase [Nitrospira sp.]
MAKYAWVCVFTVLTIGLALTTVGAGPDVGQSRASSGLSLALPLDCRVGETCWVANYVDVVPGPHAQDFHCQPRTYEGHDGTDFAIRDLDEMYRGVVVLAAESGTVRAIRNDMEDVLIKQESLGAIAGRECGNGLLVDHDGGWQTQYCHLQRGTVRVHSGDRVARGSPLGLIGISGKTEFPHLHFTVRHNGQTIDPFTGLRADAGCHAHGQPLWSEGQQISYEEAALYHIGFSDRVPRLLDIRHGQYHHEVLGHTIPTLILWVDILGVQAEDVITMRILAPDNRVALDKKQFVGRTQARRFMFVGTSPTSLPLPKGNYRGEVILYRAQSSEAIIAQADTAVRLQ